MEERQVHLLYQDVVLENRLGFGSGWCWCCDGHRNA